MTTTIPRCWFLTGSQGLYGPETLAQVEQQSRALVDQLNDAGTLPVPVEPGSRCSPTPSAIHQMIMAANADPDCIGLIAWMHTFSPAKMWITGLDALKTPFLHLHTQANVSLPWAEIDMDFMNLNQAAHGDREFGYIQTRLGVPRTTVAGHVSDPAVQARIAGWQRAARGVAAIRSLQAGPVRRQHAQRRGHRGRQGRGRAAVRRLGEHLRRQRPGRTGRRRHRRRGRRPAGAVRRRVRRSCPSCRSGGDRHESLRYGAKIEAGLRSFLTDGGFGAFTTNFEDLGGLRQLPGLAVQRLMADGYGFGGEGDWKTSVMLHTIKAIGAGAPGRHLVHGGLHLPPRARHAEDPRRAHARGLPDASPPTQPRIEIHPLGIGDREDPVRLVFDAAPGPATILGICDLGDRFRLVLNEVDVVPPDEPLPKLPVARAVWEPKPDLATSAESWITAGGPHHTVLSTAVDTDQLVDFANLLGVELLIIDGSTNRRDFADRIRWNQAYYRLARGF